MAFLKYIIILSLLLLLPDIYIYHYYVAKLRVTKWVRYSYWLVDFVLICLLVGFMFHPVRTGMQSVHFITIVLFVIILGKFSFALISSIGRLISCRWHRVMKVADIFAITFCLFIVGGVLYSFTYGYCNYKIRRVTVTFANLPQAFDGYRIVQFSDLHIGSFIDQGDEHVRQIVDMINAQNGDIVVFTGDLVNVEASELDGYSSLLSSIHAHDGVYSVMGNHDYGRYRRWASPQLQAINLKAIQDRERSFGWHLLLNEHRMIQRGDSCIVLAGSEDYGNNPQYRYGDLKKTLAGLPNAGKGLFKILLSHDPTFWRMKILPDTDIQLTLSGHTHGMQMMLGSFSPCQWLYKEWNGLYTEGERKLFVSIGVGALMSYRMGAWPEICVITLKRK